MTPLPLAKQFIKMSQVIPSFRNISKQKPIIKAHPKWIDTEKILCTMLFVFAGTFVFVGYYTIFDNKTETKEEQQHVTYGSNNESCDHVDIVGDDICDDQVNTKACAYDFGDCCAFDSDRSICQMCDCIVDLDTKESFLQQSCQNNTINTDVNHIIQFVLGDGKCHLSFNAVQYDFDLGDCCIPEVECWQEDYPNISGISGFQRTDCPDDMCILSNTFCIESKIGDGICQDYNNAAFCDYDGGDCCMLEKGTECCQCHCRHIWYYDY